MALSGSQAALMYAYLGNATSNPSGTGLHRPLRLGASRLGYYKPHTIVKVNGTLRQGNYDDFTWVVNERLWDEPDEATIDLFGFVPSEGHELIIACGSIQNGRLFRGQIVDVDRTHNRLNEGRLIYTCRALDWSFLFDRRLVTRKWVGRDGAEILIDIISSYTSGFTSRGVQRTMGELNTFEATWEEPSSVVTRLMRRLGGYWEIREDKDVAAWIGSAGLTNPRTITNAAGVTGNRTIRDFKYSRDMGKVKTRALVEGRGDSTPAPLAVGDTVIPVDDASAYHAGGGTVKVDNELVTYTGLSTLGGAVVGPGAAPQTAPTGAIVGGTNLTAGATYKYAVSFVTAAGETLPGVQLSFVAGTGQLATPTTAPTITDSGVGGGKLVNGGSYQWKSTYRVRGGGETLPSPASGTFIANTNRPTVDLTTGGPTVEGDPNQVFQVFTYRTTNGGSTFRSDNATDAAGAIENVFGDFYNDTDIVANGAPEPSVSTANLQGCYLSVIPLGPTGTTQRKLWRTTANGAQLKLLGTIANNSVTTFYDSVTDASLGANAPTADTSGLEQTGEVGPGATTLTVSDPTPFRSAGGWVRCGGQMIRYTGKTSTTLTGIPASGDGAIVSKISYGMEALALVHLTGIPGSGAGSLTHTIPANTEVNILITRNNAGAQAVIAALEGGDGIHEVSKQNRTLTRESCEALGDAELTVWSSVLETINAVLGDPNAHAGRELAVNVSEWSLTLSLRIQTATIQRVEGHPWPLRTITATSQKRSFYDVLRSLQKEGP